MVIQNLFMKNILEFTINCYHYLPPLYRFFKINFKHQKINLGYNFFNYSKS